MKTQRNETAKHHLLAQNSVLYHIKIITLYTYVITDKIIHVTQLMDIASQIISLSTFQITSSLRMGNVSIPQAILHIR